jgi:hypothetical protein
MYLNMFLYFLKILFVTWRFLPFFIFYLLVGFYIF